MPAALRCLLAGDAKAGHCRDKRKNADHRKRCFEPDELAKRAQWHHQKPGQSP